MVSARLRWLSSPAVGLKPNDDGIRSVSPFGLPKREGQPERNEPKNRRSRK